MDYNVTLWYNLTTKCYGWLTGIKFYANSIGTFYFDLWKPDGNDYILFYTRPISVVSFGAHTEPVDEKVFVEPGLLFGMHGNVGESGIIAFEYDIKHPARRYSEENTTVWTPHGLSASNLNRIVGSSRTPSLGVQISLITSVRGKYI